MNSTKMHFVLTRPSTSLRGVMDLFPNLPTYVLNNKVWRGKEPRSCAVTGAKSQTRAVGDPSPIVIDITVAYRPKGSINFAGHTKYDGWDAMVLDRAADGTLLDGKGQPLKDGDPPVYLPYQVYSDTDFDALDFGEFIDEKEVGGVDRVTVDAVHAEMMAAGRIGGSVKGGFIAAHRSRPLKKIILSNRPSGTGQDGFGTLFQNINLSTPHLEHVLMGELTKLMCEFLEGKVSIKTTGNDDVEFVDLSDSLVDCEPNEYGEQSWFNMLRSYTPITFLEELAKMVRAVYQVKVQIIEGSGLVLRHDKD